MALKKSAPKKKTAPKKNPEAMTVLDVARRLGLNLSVETPPPAIWAPLVGKPVIVSTFDEDETVAGILEAVQGGLLRLNIEGKYALVVLERVVSIFEATPPAVVYETPVDVEEPMNPPGADV